MKIGFDAGCFIFGLPQTTFAPDQFRTYFLEQNYRKTIERKRDSAHDFSVAYLQATAFLMNKCRRNHYLLICPRFQFPLNKNGRFHLVFAFGEATSFFASSENKFLAK